MLCLSPNVSLQALQITNQLRMHGYKTDTDFQNRSFKAQFKTVERKHAKVAVLIGEKDIEQGTITLKVIDTQKQLTVPMDDIINVMDTLFYDTNEEHECSCGNPQCTCK